MNRRFHVWLLCVSAVALLGRMGCSPTEPAGQAGNSTQVGNPSAVAGIIYEPDGSTPARNVSVFVRPRSTLPDTSVLAKRLVDTAFVTTNNSGQFAIDTIDTGTYVIVADDGSGNLALIDSVLIVDPDSTVEVSDTLKPAGSITGTIYLSEGGNVRKVFVLVYGLNSFVIPDTSGVFEFGNLAEGTYHLLFLSSLDDYDLVDSPHVVVVSDSATDLDTIALPYTGIPTPKGFQATYDTLNGIVVLTWNPSTFSDLDGYIVYRNDTTSSTPVKISGNSTVQDTFYTDTIFTDLLDTAAFVYEYRLKTQDIEANLSEKYSTPIQITAPSPTLVRTFFSWVTMNTMNDTASIGDSVVLIVAYSNETRPNREITWYVDHPDSLARTRMDSSLSGSDTLRYAWPDSGRKRMYVSIEDGAGTTWNDTFQVHIIQDVPFVSISGNSSVAINTPITFTAETWQRFGGITEYRWDNGIDIGYDDSTGSTYTNTFLVETTTVVQVEVTDDDGNTNTATKTVVITNDVPIVTGLKDTNISINDVVTFVVSAVDTNGIKCYFWDFGDGSANQYDTTADSTVSHMFPSSPLDAEVRVTVLDSFDNPSVETATISVLLDPPIASAGADTSVSISDSFYVHYTGTDIYGTIVRFRIDVNGDGSFEDSSSSGDEKTFAASPNAGDVNIVVQAEDDDGTTDSDTMVVHVLQDLPVPDAGDDTTVSMNDQINVHGTATDIYGTIVKWEWDIGGSGFSETTTGDTSTIAPSTPTSDLKYVLRVMDDDSNVAADTAIISVIEDPPIARAGNDTCVGRGEIVNLRGSNSTDSYGSVVKYEWDLGNLGNFTHSLTGDTSIVAPDSLFFVYECVLRVTDDDGGVALDTVDIHVTRWYETANTARFEGRSYPSSVVFDNKLWVIGGKDYYSDVWYSSDGVTWTEATSNAGFSGRYGHSCVAFQDRIYVIGGSSSDSPFENDVWYSTDGVSWIEATSSAGFSPRYLHTAVVYDGKMWIIGGRPDIFSTNLNDVWYSDDGISWIEATPSADFPGRHAHASVVFGNEMWVIGGQNTLGALDDVWRSSDGTNWTKENTIPPLPARSYLGAAVSENMIWVVGGNDDSIGPTNDCWYSTDGETWSHGVCSISYQPARLNFTTQAFAGAIWVIGGDELNDVWYLK